jgi:hypothetical protein
MCFRLSIWPKGRRESQKNEFLKLIPRTNEAAGLTVLSPNTAQTHDSFALRCLFGTGSTRTSSLKFVPTPMILFGSNTPCRAVPYRDSSNLARVPLSSGLRCRDRKSVS